MSHSPSLTQLAALFESTAAAHHRAFAATDGEDPEWPLWYAERLRKPLGALLGAPLTKSELVWALVQADKEFEAEQGEEWPRFWADFFQDTYA